MRTALAIATLVMAAAACAPVFGSERVAASASVHPSSVSPGGAFELRVKCTVAKGFHVGSADKEALSPAELSVKAPPGVSFSKPVFPRGRWIALSFAQGKIPVYEGEFSVRVGGRVDGSAKPGNYEITAVLTTQACKDDECYPPEETVVKARLAVAGKKQAAAYEDQNAAASDEEIAAQSLAGAGLLKRLAIIYLGGLLLAFTPCVYPMIPVTVGYFSSQGGQRKSKVALLALAYVLGIATTYAVLGAMAAGTGGALRNAMQAPAVLVGLAVVLAALALSMFGLYELRAPGFIQDKAFGRSGAAGALLMAALRERLFRLRFQAAAGQIESAAKVRAVRRPVHSGAGRLRSQDRKPVFGLYHVLRPGCRTGNAAVRFGGFFRQAACAWYVDGDGAAARRICAPGRCGVFRGANNARDFEAISDSRRAGGCGHLHRVCGPVVPLHKGRVRRRKDAMRGARCGGGVSRLAGRHCILHGRVGDELDCLHTGCGRSGGERGKAKHR